MSEEEIVDILDLMLASISLVNERFSKIGKSEDFVSSTDGVTLLDSISMRLQVIGESVKLIQKKDPTILYRYADIEWNKIARFRDLVSHHYEQIDYEIIYDICKNHLQKLSSIIQKMIGDLS